MKEKRVVLFGCLRTTGMLICLFHFQGWTKTPTRGGSLVTVNLTASTPHLASLELPLGVCVFDLVL